jgi:RNA-binding protein 5/10
MEQLRKHEQMSKLHLDNLAKAQLSMKPKVRDRKRKRTLALTRYDQYRDRAEERRALHGQDAVPKLISDSHTPTPKDPVAPIPPPPRVSTNKPLDEDNVGNKMLRAMGWTEGQGLGKTGEGAERELTLAIR